MPDRRTFLGALTVGLGSVVGLGLAIPGVRFLLDPLFRKGKGGEYRPLAKLGQLTPGEPKAFPIVESRRDAWVKYPAERVGTVWLVRAADGAEPKVVAFSGQCPHKGCAVGFESGGKFFCPCHKAEFAVDGRALNEVAPRGLDSLDLKLTDGADPEILVKFEQFRPMLKEKKPLV